MVTKIIGKLISTLIAIFAFLVLVALVWSGQDFSDKTTDFYGYYAAAKLIVEGKGVSSYATSNLSRLQHELSPGMGKRFVLANVPPPGLILLTPIALLRLPVAFYVWKTLLVVCLVGAIIFLLRTFSLDYKNTCYLIAGLCLSSACYEVFCIDQTATILLLSLSAALYFLQKNQDAKAGLALSIMIIKPLYILPLLIYLVGMRRWRPIIVFSCVSLGLTALAYLIMHNSGFVNYFNALSVAEPFYRRIEPTFLGQMLRLCPFFKNEIFYLSATVFVAVTFCSWFCGSDNRDNEKAILWAFLVTIPLTLLTSLYCQSYDLLLLTPALIIIFTDAVVPFGRVFKLAVIFGALAFSIPIAIAIHHFYLAQGGPFNIWFVELLIMEFAIIMKLISANET